MMLMRQVRFQKRLNSCSCGGSALLDLGLTAQAMCYSRHIGSERRRTNRDRQLSANTKSRQASGGRHSNITIEERFDRPLVGPGTMRFRYVPMRARTRASSPL